MDERETIAYRRFPEEMAPAVSSRLGRVRELVRFGVASALAWTRGAVRVTRLRLEARRLVRERRQVQLELGAAVYAGDEVAVAARIARLRALDDRLTACVGEATRTVAAARSGIAAERLAVARTEVHHTVH
jgi:hypothetical protein